MKVGESVCVFLFFCLLYTKLGFNKELAPAVNRILWSTASFLERSTAKDGGHVAVDGCQVIRDGVAFP